MKIMFADIKITNPGTAFFDLIPNLYIAAGHCLAAAAVH